MSPSVDMSIDVANTSVRSTTKTSGILKSMVPNELQALFWDINLTDFDPVAYPDYMIFRVLEFGDVAAFRWLKLTFAEEEIRRVLKSERRLSPKSATFWALIYDIPEADIAALRERPSPVFATHG